jgi:leucyl/phenylalanyl-tRNA--protein transferase
MMTPLTWLDSDTPAFPDTNTALTYPDGLLAAGGQLSPEWLIHAYTRGIFPWFSEGEPILWWSPSPRTVIPIDRLHVSKSLKKVIRKQAFHITFDHAFTEVVEACAEPRTNYPEDGTWITEDILNAYHALHQLGHAHSVEVWHNEQLVGGIYGVALGKMFFGESMFSRQSNSSKIALFYLAEQLKQWQYVAIDCQVHNNHLESMGAIQMPRPTFETLLQQHVVNIPCHWNRQKT